MKKYLSLLCLLGALSLHADPITIQITLSDASQAAYARVQTRDGDTNLNKLKLPDYVAALLMQSVNGVTKQERSADVEMLRLKIAAADTATQAAVQSALKIDANAIIPTDAEVAPSPTPIIAKPPQSP